MGIFKEKSQKPGDEDSNLQGRFSQTAISIQTLRLFVKIIRHTISNAKPFRYSVSGIIGIIG